ncbi:MAG TPA: VWA domain-containing protein, partial [bacterium]|nr:VWA domain-containing protein [bacterium]
KLVWDEITMTPGQTRSLSATIALAEADFSAPVFLRSNLPNALTLSNNVLFPKDLTGTLQCINTAHNNYNNARLLFDSPYEVYAEAEFVDLTIPAAGLSTPLELHSREIYEEKIVKFCIICTHNGAVLDSLSRYIYIPATPVSDTGLLVTIDSLDITNYPNVNIIFSSEIEETGQKLLNLRRENVLLYQNMTPISRFTFAKDTTGGVSAADIIFVLDVTGSMGNIINAVKNNIIEFADSLSQRNVDYRLAMVTFLDIIENAYPFTSNVNDFKNLVAQQNAHGGGDAPENSLDALLRASQYDFRVNAKKIIIWLTDVNYHIADNVTSQTIQQVVNALLEKELLVHAIGPESYKQQYYDPFTMATGGNYYNIYGNFRDILLDISRIKTQDRYLVSYKRDQYNTLPENQVMVKVRYAGLGGEASIIYYLLDIMSPGKSLVCYPNPFNPEVKITINNQMNGKGQVSIYNLLGQRIKNFELHNNRPQQILWNARDEQGLAVSSGLYIVQLELHNKNGQVVRESQKIMFLK